MADVRQKEKQLEQEIGARVEGSLDGVEVLAVELQSPDRFTVYVDHPTGVDHALCARVTDVLRDYLRQYSVDVSSPGIERPLRKPQHFAGAVGRRVKLRTRDRRIRGELVAADANRVQIDDTEVPFDEIVRANLIDERV
ncbi:MAG: ribosome maturation factor RimP [Gaiellaceae bacterium]